MLEIVSLTLRKTFKNVEFMAFKEVMARNYFSPIFSTYELLLDKLNEFKDADAAGTLNLETDQARRGSRGSILSGKANVDPEPSATQIPAHHLAKLSLAISPDYVRHNYMQFETYFELHNSKYTCVNHIHPRYLFHI